MTCKRYLVRKYTGSDGHTRTVSVREEKGTYRVFRRSSKRGSKEAVIFESKHRLHLEQGSLDLLPRIVETVDDRSVQMKIALERLVATDFKWVFRDHRKMSWRFIRKVLLAGNVEAYPNILKCQPYEWSKEKVLDLTGDLANWALEIDNEIDDLELLCGEKIAASEEAAEDLLLLLEE